MPTTIVGLFEDYTDAKNAIQDLEALGLTRQEISVVASAAKTAAARESSEELIDGAADGAGAGAVAGTAIGGTLGLLAGLGAIAIPGIGPVLAAGPLIAAITGASVGAAVGAGTGGLIGALVEEGISDDEASYYAEGVRRGGTLLTVRADSNQSDQVADILRRHNASDVRGPGQLPPSHSTRMAGVAHESNNPETGLPSAIPSRTNRSEADDSDLAFPDRRPDTIQPGGTEPG
jgi:uncharacterized membrane protein